MAPKRTRGVQTKEKEREKEKRKIPPSSGGDDDNDEGSGPSGYQNVQPGDNPPGYDPVTNQPKRFRHINDNRVQMAFSFPSRSYMNAVIGCNLNLGPVIGITIDSLKSPKLISFLFLASRGEALRSGIPSASVTDTTIFYAIANCLAPYVPTVLDEVTAKAIFKSEIINLMHDDIQRGDLLSINPNAYKNALTQVDQLQPYANELPSTLEEFVSKDTVTLHALMTSASCAALMEWCCITSSLPKLDHAATELYIYVLIAFSKRGDVTEYKLNRVGEQLRLELGYAITLRSETVKQIYAQFGHLINRDNANSVFESWSKDMTSLSLRMQIAVQQASGSGLTTLTAFKNAYLMFTDFSWLEVQKLLRLEWINIIAAFKAVNNNRYYGFSQDMGPAAFTKYKSLGYVAKELLIRHGGSEYRGLSGYAGWTRSPVNKAELDTLIKAYIPKTIALGDAEAETGITDMLNAVNMCLDLI